ncbi:hypothetical protein GCM10009646_90920 [Streptomyces aureus]
MAQPQVPNSSVTPLSDINVGAHMHADVQVNPDQQALIARGVQAIRVRTRLRIRRLPGGCAEAGVAARLGQSHF